MNSNTIMKAPLSYSLRSSHLTHSVPINPKFSRGNHFHPPFLARNLNKFMIRIWGMITTGRFCVSRRTQVKILAWRASVAYSLHGQRPTVVTLVTFEDKIVKGEWNRHWRATGPRTDQMMQLPPKDSPLRGIDTLYHFGNRNFRGEGNI